MDMCSRLGTHATVVRARWITINHLIYERNSLSVACFLTCNNVTTPQQLRKMPGKGVEGCSRRVAIGWDVARSSALSVLPARGSEMYLITAILIYLMHFKASAGGNVRRVKACGMIGFGFTEIQIWQVGVEARAELIGSDSCQSSGYASKHTYHLAMICNLVTIYKITIDIKSNALLRHAFSGQKRNCAWRAAEHRCAFWCRGQNSAMFCAKRTAAAINTHWNPSQFIIKYMFSL